LSALGGGWSSAGRVVAVTVAVDSHLGWEGERVGLNKETPAQLAEARLSEWRRTGYDEWRAMLDGKDVRLVVGEDGNQFTVVSQAVDDGDGRVRLVVAVNDGGWPAFVPLVETRS